MVNPQTKELIESVETVLGFVWGEQYEGDREKRGMPELVPVRIREIAAQQAFNRLEKAVIAFKALDKSQVKFDVMME